MKNLTGLETRRWRPSAERPRSWCLRVYRALPLCPKSVRLSPLLNLLHKVRNVVAAAKSYCLEGF